MSAGDYAFGAAFDGDGDRNMILGAKAKYNILGQIALWLFF